MSNILLLNKIAKVGTDIFDDKYTVSDNCENADAIMVRSAAMHDMELPASVKAIAIPPEQTLTALKSLLSHRSFSLREILPAVSSG